MVLYFFKLVPLFAQIYALFGAPFLQWCPKVDKYQVYVMMMVRIQQNYIQSQEAAQKRQRTNFFVHVWLLKLPHIDEIMILLGNEAFRC